MFRDTSLDSIVVGEKAAFSTQSELAWKAIPFLFYYELMLSKSFLFIVRQSTYCFCTDLFISISVEFGSTSKREAFLLAEKILFDKPRHDKQQNQKNNFEIGK